MERFILKKLSEVEAKEQFCIEISNGFAALEDLDAEVEINKFGKNLSRRESRLI
jgi:hypothetical protein